MLDGPSSTIIAPASRTSLALGTYNVPMPDETCTRGKEDKSVKITITTCAKDEFTCYDGNCIAFDMRCNRIRDCPDLSEERDCVILKIDKTTYYPPITVDSLYNTVKVKVNVSMEVLKILDIDEVEGNFQVSFRLHTTWYDGRHTYVNLKEDKDLNSLTGMEQDDMWKPFIIFVNTKTQNSVVNDRKVIARVSKVGGFVVSTEEEAIRSYYYKGSENPVTFSRIYDIDFICRYNMAWYPFDIQKCSLEFNPDGNTGEYIQLVRDKFKYLGKQELSVYFIRDTTFSQIPFDSINTVQGNTRTIGC